MSESESHSDRIVLSADQQTVALREINDLMRGLSLVGGELTKGKSLARQLTGNILYLAEASLANLSKLTGVDSESAARREERYAELRRANLRLRELEALLGAGQTPEHTQLAVQGLMERIRDWWRRAGLGHISELSLNGYGQVDMKLSCHLFGGLYVASLDTPSSDKLRKEQWHDSLRAQGFVLSTDHEDSDSIVDCDASRAALLQLVTSAIPSAHVYSITNHSSAHGVLMLVDAQVFVRKLSDLAALPDALRA